MASVRRTFVRHGMKFFHVFFLFFASNVAFVSGQSEEITDDNWDVVLRGHWMIKL